MHQNANVRGRFEATVNSRSSVVGSIDRFARSCSRFSMVYAGERYLVSALFAELCTSLRWLVRICCSITVFPQVYDMLSANNCLIVPIKFC